MSKEWSNLAKIVYARTYSRELENGAKETWEQTVDRVVEGNIGAYRGTGLLDDNEEERLKYFLLHRKAMPAGRGLWFSGADRQKDLKASALTNCYVLNSEDWNNFPLAMDLLMLGGGVGMTVEHKYTSKLPRIKRNVVITNKETNDADFIVPDSREGWVKLLKRVLKSYFETGESFSYSCILIRGRGEVIKGFGGKASGKVPLIDFITKLAKLLDAKAGKRLYPIDVADIVCMIGEVVVAGNNRRSAILIQGDPFDKEFLKAKRWDLGMYPSYRAMANFSVNCNDVDDLHPLFWKTYEHGEPFGIVNIDLANKYGRIGELKKDNAIAANPCQPAWATVLTPLGIRSLGDIHVGDTIWSESGWTNVIKKYCNGVKPVFEYRTTAGSFVGTENHRVVSNGVKIEAKDCNSIDVLKGLNDVDHMSDIYAIMDGLVLGDGSVHMSSYDKVYLIIGENDQDYFESEISNLIIDKHAVKHNAYKIITSLNENDLPVLPVRIIPEKYVYARPSTVASFLRGLYSANGSIAGNRVTLKSTSFKLIQQVQIMLSSLGIRSYYTTNKSKKVKFSNGEYVCKQSYDLNITSDRGIFRDQIGFIQQYKNEHLDQACEIVSKDGKVSYDVIDTIYLGEEEVFDITVDNRSHTYWTGGLNVSNCGEQLLPNYGACNLTELVLGNMDSEEELYEAARLMYRYAKRVSLEGYIQKPLDDEVIRSRRVGVGITGCLQSYLFNKDTLDKAYKIIQEEDKKYSKELGVNESIRLTTTKPSGSISLVADVTAGIHPAYSEYYIRRVRFDAGDSLIDRLKEAGHYIEPAENFPDTLVVDFPCRSPKGTPVADKDWGIEKQLEVVTNSTQWWSDSAVSVTVYYKKDEIPFIKEWLRDNIGKVKSISFLCHSEHGFKQAPYEAITKEQYDMLNSKISPIDFSDISLGSLESMECEGGACPVK